MSRTEEVALSRLATIATGEPPKLVETSVLRDLVADNRQPVHRMVAPVVQAVVGADKVVTGNDGPGWTNTPQVDQWRPPGLAIMDRLVDQQDQLDRANREAELRKIKRGGV